MQEQSINGGETSAKKQKVSSSSVHICSHPIIQHKLTQLRRAETSTKHFRELLSEVTLFLGFEATKDLVLEEIRRKRDGSGDPRQLMHPHTLIVRDSSGPAPR